MTRLTLDWDALTRASTPEFTLQPLIDGLQAWLDWGWEVTAQTEGDPAAAAAILARMALSKVVVEHRTTVPPPIVADTAVVEPGAAIGGLSRVWRFTHIRPGAHIGVGCNVGQGVFVDAGVLIGAGCKLQNGVTVPRGVVIGDGVFIGPNTSFTNDLYPRAGGDWQLTPTLIGSGASIGANSVIICGNQIGPSAMIGAGSVVARKVPPHGLVVALPARQIGYVCACGHPAESDSSETWHCSTCGSVVPVAGP